MKNQNTLICIGLLTTVLYGCKQTTDPEQVKTLYEQSITAGTDGFCITDHETADNYENLASILRDLDYVCYQINYEAATDLPDSIMILNRNNINGTKTIIYDFAKRNRTVETWNRDNGNDVSEKIAEDVYVRTFKAD